jgi:hypothetical protein
MLQFVIARLLYVTALSEGTRSQGPHLQQMFSGIPHTGSQKLPRQIMWAWLRVLVWSCVQN